jgi:S-formylglutathione hydrolase FrmB
MTGHRWKRARLVVVGALIVTAVGRDGATAAGVDSEPGVPEIPHPVAHGIELLGAQAVDPDAAPDHSRMVDLTMSSDEIFEPRGPQGQDLDKPVTVRVWLPPNYDPDRHRPYPVLYLLGGGGAWYGQWTTPAYPPYIDGRSVLDHAIDDDPTDATPGTPFPGIVVMPEGGWAGWYTNWAGGTQGGFAPNWENFHVKQLVPWIDANFNTSGRRSGRAIAGVSMGGIGTLMYATRNPLVFSAVGSFSGVPDLRLPLLHRTVSDNASGFPGAGANLGLDDLENQDYWLTSPPPGDVEGRFRAVFGNPGPWGNWPLRNPIVRAFTYNAFDGRFAIYSGQSTPELPSDEADFGTTNQAFHQVLRAYGVDHRYCSGPGTHTAPYFQNDLADFLNYVYGEAWQQCTANAGWVDDWQPVT